jgi:hypothetical protein
VEDRPLALAHETWCRGCRLAGRRPLSDAERAWARRLRIGHAWRAAVGVVVAPFSLYVGSAPVVSGNEPSLGDPAVFFAFAILLIALPVSILFVRDHVVALRRLDQDLKDGGVLLFEPPVDPAQAGDESDETAALSPASFALLELSRRIVDLANRDPRVDPEDVVEVDAHIGGSLYAPLYLPVEGPSGTRLRQRALSGPERNELEGLGRRLGTPRFSTVVAAAVLVWLFTLVATPRPPLRRVSPLDFGDVFSTLVGIFICVRMLVRDARSIVLAGRIQKDLMVGLVVKNESESGANSEYLPVSRLLWRLGGAPAGWRDRGRGADRLRQGL